MARRFLNLARIAATGEGRDPETKIERAQLLMDES
jgi:hypothetical protein